MPKIKTRKSIVKRFKITKKGKILRMQSFTSHLRVKKSKRKKRALGRSVEVTGFYAKKLKLVLGIKRQTAKRGKENKKNGKS